VYREIVPAVHEMSTPKVAGLAMLDENVVRSVNIPLVNVMCLNLG
jgi:UDP-N-acetyl-D-mannosaminuronate dehydrogenase